jgi:hypothetical protein
MSEPETPALSAAPISRHRRSETFAVMCGVLCNVMAAFTDWQYRHGLFTADPYLLAKHDAPVVEEDVWH